MMNGRHAVLSYISHKLYITNISATDVHKRYMQFGEADNDASRVVSQATRTCLTLHVPQAQRRPPE